MSIINKSLQNGMRAILVPQKGAVSMTIMVFVRVGSRYEHAEVGGASHFIEHLMFKGTKRRPNTLTLTKELDRYGAEFNAYTSKDLTAYYIKIDAAHTPLAVDLLHDMLFHSLYDPKEIDRERGVIVEEINMFDDNPHTLMEDVLEEVLFPSSTLGRSIAGSRETVRAVTPEQLITYRDNYYIPSRMTVVVAGKIVPGIWGMLNKTFGTVTALRSGSDKLFVPFVRPEKLKLPFDFRQKKIEQVQLGLAFHGLPYGHEQAPALGILMTILGGTMSSRLFTEVRERRGLCYSIRAAHQPFEDTGMVAIMAGLDRTRMHEAMHVIRKELQKTVAQTVTNEELRRAKDNVRGKLMLAMEDSAHQADWYGKQWVFQSKALSPEERLRKFERVTAKEIQAIAKIVFQPKRMAAALVGPFESRDEVEKLMR